MLSFDDILPSKKIFGGDPSKNQPKNIKLNKSFKQPVNKQNNVISINTETDTKEEPKTDANFEKMKIRN